MASPCKKLKLTPNKRLEASQRFTQESKVTSTPQRPSERIISPNISSIQSGSSSSSVRTNKTSRTRLSDIFDNEENVSSTNNRFNETAQSTASAAVTENSEKSISIVAGEDYDTYLNNLGKIKYSGNVWKQYKPLHEGTLYAQLLMEPKNVQGIVNEFFLLYTRNPEEATGNMLEFCVNLCGFQNLNVAQHYDFRNDASKRIIKMMESDEVLEEYALKTNGKYLFMEPRGQLANILKISVYNFLQKLIINSHESGILYDEFFSKHFFTFIKDMSSSEIRAIRHTGVIFAIKTLTAIVMVYSQMLNDPNNSLAESSNNMNEKEIQKQDINAFIEYFYIIFIKNCRLQDSKVMLMRVECIHELSIWIRYFPKIFITQLQAVNYLFKLIIDASRDVRYAALETCERLVATPSVFTSLKSITPDFTETIAKRFYDVDRNVSIKAIDIFTAFLKYDESLITTHRFKLLVSLVFDKCFPIGEAAARFLISYLQATEESEEMILIQLAKFSLKPGYATRELLIEGCINNCPVIQNWDVYTRILLCDDVEIYIKDALAEMFSESVHQTLIGKSTIMRDLSRKVTNIDRAQYVKIAKYLPQFNELLRKYKDYPKMLTQFLKICLLLDNDAFNETYCPDICHTMGILFHYHNDENLLNKLVETFQYFCNVTSLSRVARQAIACISSEHVNELESQLSEEGEYIPAAFLKVKILFSKINLTKYVNWETLFDAWGKVDESITCSLVVCCKWYLIWSLKNITDNADTVLRSELTDQIVLCSRICKEFISTTFNMLQHLNGQPLHFIVYECLCEVHITYMRDLERPIRVFKSLEQLKLTIDMQLRSPLMYFLDRYVINNTTMTLDDRRAHVVNYVDLVHQNVLPIEYLAHVFKYYYCYNKEFGPIIEASLTSIAEAPDENTLLLIVIYTITVAYEDVVRKYNVVDITTEEARNLKLLVKQLLTFKAFRSAKRSFKKLIYFSFKYAFKDESKYAFLYFTKYFVDLLIDDDDKKELLEFCKNKLPSGAETNAAILFIASYMKNFKTPAKKAERIKTKGASKENKENKKPLKVKTRVPRKESTSKSNPSVSTPAPKRRRSNTARTRKSLQVSQETEMSEDDLTIHDSESDDLNESFTGLKI